MGGAAGASVGDDGYNDNRTVTLVSIAMALQLLLEGLAHGVSEGHVASGELAGIPPTSVSQQARR